MSGDYVPGGEQEFLRPGTARSRGIWLVIAGVGGLCFAAIGFAAAIFGRVGQFQLQAMTTLPILASIGALAAGWTILKAPRKVEVGPDGLTVETDRGIRRLRWDEVGSAISASGAMSHRRYLNITDVRGKSLAKLDESFAGFDEMVAQISRFVEAKGDDTALIIHRKKARRQAALAFVVGLLMASGAVFIAWQTREDQRASRLLAEKGEEGQAEIIRRFVAPNGVTKRLEYRVVGAGGRSGTRNAEVHPLFWDLLEGKQSVPVVYVRDEPEISRLAVGEVVEDDFTKTPAGGYALAILGGLMALFMLGFSPFMWNGWDLAHDSKAGRWSVKRYGKVVWSSRGKDQSATIESFLKSNQMRQS